MVFEERLAVRFRVGAPSAQIDPYLVGVLELQNVRSKPKKQQRPTSSLAKRAKKAARTEPYASHNLHARSLAVFCFLPIGGLSSVVFERRSLASCLRVSRSSPIGRCLRLTYPAGGGDITSVRRERREWSGSVGWMRGERGLSSQEWEEWRGGGPVDRT